MSSRSSSVPISVLSSDIYSQLDHKLNAYSVYPTKPPEDYPLFQLVFVESSSRHRKSSPRYTPLNLRAVCDNIRRDRGLYGRAGEVLRPFLQRFQEHFRRTQNASRSALQVVEEGDMVRRGRGRTGGVSAGEFGGFELGVKDEVGIESAMVVKVTKWEKYIGVGLKELIMDTSKHLLRVVFLHLSASMQFPVGTGKLLAVVTKSMVVDIDMVYSAAVRAKRFGGLNVFTGFLNVGAGVENKSVAGKDRIRREQGKLGGLHMIVLQIRRVDTKKWVLSGAADVSTSNDQTSYVGGMKHLKQWVRNHTPSSSSSSSSSNNSSHVKSGRRRTSDVVHHQPVRSQSKAGNVDGFNGASDDESSDDEYKGGVSDDYDCVSIDLSEDIQEFAFEQLHLARFYEEQAETDTEREHVVTLVRAVLQHAESNSTQEALKILAGYHASGFGVTRDTDLAKCLMKSAEYLQGNVDDLWEDIAQEFLEIPNPPLAEKRLVEKCLWHMSKKSENKKTLMDIASILDDDYWKGTVLKYLYLEQTGVIEKKTSMHLPSTAPNAFFRDEREIMREMQAGRRCTPKNFSLDSDTIDWNLARTEVLGTRQFIPVPDFPWQPI